MKTKFLIGAFAFLVVFGFTACDDSSSATTSAPVDVCAITPKEGCSFKKEDNVWRFYFHGSSYVHIYTWVDDSTVEYKECLNSYHMDRDDKTITDAVRDELFQQAMDECTP